MATLGRLRTVWSGVAGSPYYTNLYFLTDATGTGMQDSCDAWTDLIDAFSTSLATSLVPTIDADVPLIDSTNNTLTGSTTVSGATVDCDGGGDLMPPATQGLIRWRTDAVVAGRRLRGRTFLPGMTEGDGNAGGAVLPALKVSMDGYLATTFIPATQAAAPLVVYGPTHFAFSEVVSGDMWEQFAVLRSRRD